MARDLLRDADCARLDFLELCWLRFGSAGSGGIALAASSAVSSAGPFRDTGPAIHRNSPASCEADSRRSGFYSSGTGRRFPDAIG